MDRPLPVPRDPLLRLLLSLLVVALSLAGLEPCRSVARVPSPEPSPRPVGASGALPAPAPSALAGGALTPSAALAAAQEALKRAEPGAAIPLLRQAADGLGDSPAGGEARYLLAQSLLEAGHRSEALEAYQAFLRRDRERVSPRLVQVAEAAAARLASSRSEWDAWRQLQRLELELAGLSHPERVARLEAFLDTGPPETVARRARRIEVEEAWAARDWKRAIRALERAGADAPDAEAVFHQQLVQARRELRRTRGAFLAALVLAVGSIGCLGGRPWRRLRARDRLWLGVLLANWSLVAWLVYGLYVLGRRSGDVTPVTVDRFLVLWGALCATLLAGVGWSLLLRARLTPARLSLVSVLAGGTLTAAALYLFCYRYDYLPALGL